MLLKLKKILLIGSSSEIQTLRELMSDSYEFINSNSTDELLENWNSIFKEVNAVIMDSTQATLNDHAFLKQSAEIGRFAFIPLLIIADSPQNDAELKCLDYDVVDFITMPFQKITIKNRIENAIHIKDSASFYEIERMLKELPSNIYLKDADGKYIFATHYWHHLDHSNDPDWTIRGKTDIEIRKDKENAKMAMEKDMEVIRSGKGEHYVIEINVGNIQEFFEVFKEPVKDHNGNITGIIGLLNNVTEHELLKQQLKTAASIDGLTGLYNRKEIQSRIDNAVENCHKNGGTLSLLMLDIDNFKQVNDSYGHKQGDIVIVSLANILKNNQPYFKGKFSAGRWGGEEFMLLLHDTEISAAAYIAELIRQCFANIIFPNMRSQTISLGVTQLKQGDTSDSLCIRVDDGLYQAKKTGKNRVHII
ncbi:MAG: diguanylate cyclase [Ruminococcus sp.]|nr:diguanylate cyclase [Ruminococcus sp.]